MNKQGKVAIFIYGVNVICPATIVKKCIGDPMKMNANGEVELPPKLHSSPVTRSQPVPGKSGITPELSRFHFSKSAPKKSNKQRLDFDSQENIPAPKNRSKNLKVYKSFCDSSDSDDDFTSPLPKRTEIGSDMSDKPNLNNENER